MFTGCNSLAGGSGTKFADAKVATYAYAHIDGGTGSPGYFTGTAAPTPTPTPTPTPELSNVWYKLIDTKLCLAVEDYRTEGDYQRDFRGCGPG